GQGHTTTIDSEVLTVQDSPPDVIVGIDPASPRHGQTLVCSVDASNIDVSDTLSSKISWKKNGSPYTGPTSTTTLPGDTISGTYVAAFDGFECDAQTSDGHVTVDADTVVDVAANEIPTTPVVTITPGGPAPGDKLVCTSTSTDGDGDAITYTYSWKKNGST